MANKTYTLWLVIKLEHTILSAEGSKQSVTDE